MFNNKKEIKELYQGLIKLAESTAGLGERAEKAIGVIMDGVNKLNEFNKGTKARIQAIEEHLGIKYQEETTETVVKKAGYVTKNAPEKIQNFRTSGNKKEVLDFIEKIAEKEQPQVKVPRKYIKSLKRRQSPVYMQVTPELANEIKTLYDSGVPRKVIAKRTGVSLATVGRWYKGYNDGQRNKHKYGN